MKALVLVIDSFGIGALPDAEKYGDGGSNTALHICEAIPGEKWPNLRRYGLGNAAELLGFSLPGCGPVERPEALYGVMAEKSPGKDTTTGHWEIAGLELDKPFTTFPSEYPSFPEEMVRRFEEAVGRKILGNKAASGTVIIEELYQEHKKTGAPICYTSGDSVFQIAAHEEVIPLEELYEMCRAARKICDDWQVGRVIARPFIGESGSLQRTAGRRDFSIPLPGPSLLDHLQSQGVVTAGVGKIGDIFLEQGLDESYHDKGNEACLKRTLDLAAEKREKDLFVFVNLVDTDMIYGHRRDVKGYFDAVAAVDKALPNLEEALASGDLLIVTADHGCDPTYRGTDHTREYVPLLAFRKGYDGKSVGIRGAFSDVAASLADYFNVPPYPRGRSFLLSVV
ncbi:MAG: phosphopentomutase [Spirochaetales bacterium]|nr:phosphopentomutase [Spirochaetales bacterium]